MKTKNYVFKRGKGKSSSHIVYDCGKRKNSNFQRFCMGIYKTSCSQQCPSTNHARKLDGDLTFLIYHGPGFSVTQ